MLSNNEKLELINSMAIVEHDMGGGEVVYVLVEDNQENREMLYKLGLSDEEINEKCFAEDNTLDISMIAFQYADWYNGKEKKFYNEESNDIRIKNFLGFIVDNNMTENGDALEYIYHEAREILEKLAK